MSGVDRRRLENERALLEASLADAHTEFDAGELDEASFKEITARDQARLVELEEELARWIEE